MRLCILAVAPSPYRTSLHLRIVREISDVEVHSLYLYQSSGHAYELDQPDIIHPRTIEPLESTLDRSYRPRNLVIQWSRTRRLFAILTTISPDLLVVCGYANLALVGAVQWARRRQVPVSLYLSANARCGNTNVPARIVKYPLIRWMVSSVSHIGVPSEFGKEFFRAYGAQDRQFILIPPEPDYDVFNTIARSRDGREGLSWWIPGRRRLVFSGRLVREKRPDLLLRAFAAIAADRPNWDLIMAGDGPLREGLVASVPQHLAKRIWWLGFVGRQTDLARVYHSCDVHVLPSDYEPWGVVTVEAAACGLAVVVSDVVGASASIVQDRRNGRIFRHGDTESLTSALLAVTDEHLLASYKQQSPAVISEWRKEADPVEGCRKLIAAVDVANPGGTE